MDFKQQAAQAAAALIKDGSIIGLGAGSTMVHMVSSLKEEKDKGLSFKVLTSSFATRQLLLKSGFAVLNTSDIEAIDIYFDGCDQFDVNLNALKSGGGIHTQEKLLATMAKEFVIVGDESKFSGKLETKFPLVIEVLPQAASFVPTRVQSFFPGVKTLMRLGDKKDGAVITENGNYLFDLWFNDWPELSKLNPVLKNIPGIVETSLFYNIAAKAIIAGESGVRTLYPGSA